MFERSRINEKSRIFEYLKHFEYLNIFGLLCYVWRIWLCSTDLAMLEGFWSLNVNFIVFFQCSKDFVMFEGFCYVRVKLQILIKMIQFYQSDEFRAKWSYSSKLLIFEQSDNIQQTVMFEHKRVDLHNWQIISIIIKMIRKTQKHLKMLKKCIFYSKKSQNWHQGLSDPRLAGRLDAVRRPLQVWRTVIFLYIYIISKRGWGCIELPH